MRLVWDPSDVEPGVLVASRGRNGKYQMPCILAYQISGEGEPLYGLCSMDTGSFMQFNDGSKAALAEKLTEGGYLPVTKQLFEGVAPAGLIDNRLGLPVVTLTRIDSSLEPDRNPMF